MKTSNLFRKKSQRMLIALAAIEALLVQRPAFAETVTILHSFTGFPDDGSSPVALVVEGSDGQLYGTTSGGGSAGSGTIFTIGKDGTGYSILHHFTPLDFFTGDAISPQAGLLEASDGLLYGTAPYYQLMGSRYAGAAFAIGESGSPYSILHVFGQPSLRLGPYAALIEGSDGVLYGASLESENDVNGFVFSLSKDGSQYAVLHPFVGGPDDGARPIAAVLEGSDGALYGTTTIGGSDNRGTVFTVNKDGTGYSVLFQFTNSSATGFLPKTTLVEAADGQLYGTTTGNAGNVFSIAKDGMGFRVVYTFAGLPSDGDTPDGRLAIGSDGALYGVTTSGGSGDCSCGTVYKVNTDGSGFEQLHSFRGTPSDGANPYGGVVFGSDGALYGTTSRGGTTFVNGIVYRLDL